MRQAGITFALVLLVAAAGPSQATGAYWGDSCRSIDHDRSHRIGSFYEARERAAVWVTQRGLTAAGERLAELLRSADTTYRDGHEVMTECLERALAGRDADVSRGRLEVMLTDAYLVLGGRALAGSPTYRELLAPLDRGQATEQMLDRIAQSVRAPSPTAERATPRADELAAALARYEDIRAAGGWPHIGEGPRIEPGMRDPRVPDLRERLALSADLGSSADATGGTRLTEDLVAAVRTFQARHGLDVTGRVDEATRTALNVPVEQRIRQLRVNRERMRERSTDTADAFVRVNIPDFRVELHRNGEIIYDTRAVVGRPDRQTPVLDDRITRLTLNPGWNVPARIAREDLAPRFARDPGYAERHGYRLHTAGTEISDIDWNDPPAVPLRQEPGPTNALGRIRFDMPNPRAIFLHDTPERHLFQSRTRAFSAGCVRVEEPLELAARILGFGDDGVQQLATAIRSGETRAIRFGRTVPVELVYFTAWVDDRGQVHFRDDIYGKDEPALAALKAD